MMKILVADDEAGMRTMLHVALVRLGYEVVLAENGREAWDLFCREPVRMVVSDWLMPEMDGLALCQKIRARRAGDYTYFLLFTGKSGPESYREAMTREVDDFLTKPLDMDDLVIRLRVAERMLGLRAHVEKLERIFAICSYCKKIRDDQGQWLPLDVFLSQRGEISFSHSYCPECNRTQVEPMVEEFRTRMRRGTRKLPAAL
jgi:DNA-binding response OmpR family regulator